MESPDFQCSIIQSLAALGKPQNIVDVKYPQKSAQSLDRKIYVACKIFLLI